MILKFSIILLLSCTFFAANVVGKDRKKGSTQNEEALEQNQDTYGNQNSQSGQYYDNGQQNPNQQQYDSYGQTSNGYGQNPNKRPGHKPVSIGNGRGNTNVVSINNNEDPYIVGYSSPGGAFEYDQYGNRRDIPSYPGSKGNGNNVIVVKDKGRNPDTVVLSSQSRNGQKSTIIVSNDGVHLNSGASRSPYNSRGSYPQNNYGQSQDYGYY